MVNTDLNKLVEELKNYQGITRKRPIAEVVHSFPGLVQSSSGMQVIADFGEDAAVISLSTDAHDDGVLLLAADGIMAELLNADPYWAGYCAVLVNLHDIAAMGGVPLALVDVLAVKDNSVLTTLTNGMSDACTKFGVPVVGGHIHPDSEFNSVDIAVLGIAKRSGVIYSHTAEIGDNVIFAMDLDGRVHKNSKYSWDTTQHKSPEVVRCQLMVMSELGNANLVRSGKDISNPGTLGTLGMLLESSKKGAVIDLNAIPYPGDDELDFIHWLKVYQGSGFVVSCEPKKNDSVIEKFSSVGLSAQVAGEIVEEPRLIIKQDEKYMTLFDFNQDTITGI